MDSGTETKYLTVLLCDSNQMQSQLLVSALRRRPELQVYACPMQISPILQVVEASSPEVVVFSIQRTGDAWRDLAALRRVRLTHPTIGCLVLTDFYDRELVVDVFRSGAKGIFCFSEQPFRMFCRCLHCIHEGQIWANAEQLQYLAEALSFVPSLRVVNAKGGRLLTAREEQVVALVADGLGNRDISQELNISEHTVKKYLFHIFEKLGISSRVELVLYAVNHGDHREAEWLPSGSSTQVS